MRRQAGRRSGRPEEIALGELADDGLAQDLRVGRQRHVTKGPDDPRAHAQVVLERLRPGSPAAQMGANASHHLIEADRLDREVVGARVQTFDGAGRATGSGHQQDGQGRGLLAQPKRLDEVFMVAASSTSKSLRRSARTSRRRRSV